tara:strand:- start:30 stop:131 length:102 start_codon:yes stop_codon:yes gene_type:complete
MKKGRQKPTFSAEISEATGYGFGKAKLKSEALG